MSTPTDRDHFASVHREAPDTLVSGASPVPRTPSSASGTASMPDPLVPVLLPDTAQPAAAGQSSPVQLIASPVGWGRASCRSCHSPMCRRRHQRLPAGTTEDPSAGPEGQLVVPSISEAHARVVVERSGRSALGPGLRVPAAPGASSAGSWLAHMLPPPRGRRRPVRPAPRHQPAGRMAGRRTVRVRRCRQRSGGAPGPGPWSRCSRGQDVNAERILTLCRLLADMPISL